MSVMETIACLALVSTAITGWFGFRYFYLYKNLYKNFSSFLKFVEDRYIEKNDVILHNAIVEALEQAREKENTFEIKAYSKLLDRLREGT